MKKQLSVFSLILATAMSTSAIASDNAKFADGFIAQESGDYKTALQVMGPLADKGHAHAQFNVGLMYHSGLGVKRDEQRAVQWYHKAAENGYKQAQEYLAVGYGEGWFGLPKDPKRAQYWEKRLEGK